jgi:hypothetical protein
MNVQMLPLKSVKPYWRNPRKNDDAVDHVARSISEFGFRQPIVVDADNVIIVGHARYKAAKKLKLKVVPVHVASDLDAAAAAKLRIADNQTHDMSSWDDELLITELKEMTIADVQPYFPSNNLEELLGHQVDPVEAPEPAEGGEDPAEPSDAAPAPTVELTCPCCDGIYEMEKTVLRKLLKG